MKRSPAIYGHELDALVRSRIPQPIRDSMEKLGWNAFGVYELVKEEIANERRKEKRTLRAKENSNG